jgi:hypothetical protein
MYSPREREQRRIVDQRCEKLSQRKRRYNAKRMKDREEPLWLSFKIMYASG